MALVQGVSYFCPMLPHTIGSSGIGLNFPPHTEYLGVSHHRSADLHRLLPLEEFHADGQSSPRVGRQLPASRYKFSAATPLFDAQGLSVNHSLQDTSLGAIQYCQ
jgi:hypothetical protein